MLRCSIVVSYAWMTSDSLWFDGPHRRTEFHGQAVLEEGRWTRSLGQLIQILVHWREESNMLVHAALEIPNDVSVEIEFRLLNEICWHMLLETSASCFVIEPHSAIVLEHSMQFIELPIAFSLRTNRLTARTWMTRPVTMTHKMMPSAKEWKRNIAL